jgi:hypothetical protein
MSENPEPQNFVLENPSKKKNKPKEGYYLFSNEEWQNRWDFLSTKKIPDSLKGKENLNKKKTWKKSTKNCYCLLEVMKSTAMVMWLGFYIKVKNPVTGDKIREARLVPKFGELPELFKEYHDDKGHPGRDAMYSSLRLIYSWDGMKKDVERYLRTCEWCQQHKGKYNQNDNRCRNKNNGPSSINRLYKD